MKAKICVLLLVFFAIRSCSIMRVQADSAVNALTLANVPFHFIQIATELWSILQDSVLQIKLESQRQTDSKLAIGRIGGMDKDKKYFGCKQMDVLPVLTGGSCISVLEKMLLVAEVTPAFENKSAHAEQMDVVCRNKDRLGKIMACMIGKLNCLTIDLPSEETEVIKGIKEICKHKEAILCYIPIGKQTMTNPLGTCINKALITGHGNVKTLDDVINPKFQCPNKDEMAKWWKCQQKKRVDCLTAENQEKYSSILPTEERWKMIIQFQCDKQKVLSAQCDILDTGMKCAANQIREFLTGADKTPCQWTENIKKCISSDPGTCSDEYIAVQKQIMDMIFCGKEYESPVEASTPSDKENKGTTPKTQTKSDSRSNKMKPAWLTICVLVSYIGSW